ncbi:MAG: serine hydrolase, partial [Mycobacteriales bacterium]
MRPLPARRPIRVISALISALVITGAAWCPSALAASGTAPSRAGSEVVGGPEMATTGTITSAGTPAVPRSVTAAGFVVADLDSGAVYAARNPHLHSPPASTLKTLTALVLLPRLDPGRVLVADNSDAAVDGTRVGIIPNGKYSIEQLFQALLMMSGNDAAELLARADGSRAQTVADMNAKARQLRALDTFAGTPSGLDAPGQMTSPYDLALINRATMKLPSFRRYVAMRQSTFGAAGGSHFAIQNKNRMYRDGYPGAIGIKDGFTDAAQHTFIGAATRGGRTYIVSMVRADRTYGKQAEALLDWAFALPAGSKPVGKLVEPDGVDPVRPSAAPATGSGRAATGALGTPARPGHSGAPWWLVGLA